MSSETKQEKYNRRLTSEYNDLQRRLDESCRKEEAQQKAIRAKRAEKRAIKKAGGGKAIAKQLLGGKQDKGMAEDTDFHFGHNSTNDHAADDNSQSSSECMGSCKCERCGKFHGYCREVEERKMLPTGNESEPKRGSRKGGMEWLKNEDLTTTPQEAKILMVRYNKEGRFGARVEMKLAFKGATKYIGVPPKMDDKNPNYRNLTSAFGHDENNWVDKTILLSLEQDEFSSQYFLRIDTPNSQKRTTATRGSGR